MSSDEIKINLELDKAVMVSSVKGGTGKTLTSTNLAYYLKQKFPDKEVALIDLDIDSSNLAEFIGAKGGELKISDDYEKRYIPYVWNGIKMWSMSLLTEREKAVSMRGTSHQTLLLDVLANTNWGKIDFLVLDQPAGASDIFKSTIELIGDNLVGGIITTLPITEVDLQRAIKLHLYNGIKVLGVIENMSYFEYKVGKGVKRVKVFGESRIKEICEEYNVPFLGEIPLSPRIAENVRAGKPMLGEPYNEPILKAVEAVANAEKLGLLSKLKREISDKIKSTAEKLLADFVLTVNNEVDIPLMLAKYKYPGGKIIDFILVDRSKRKVISRTHFKLDPNLGKLVVVKNPKRIDWEIITTFRTLARVVAGKRKVNGKEIPYDLMDAWLNDEIRVYGYGITTRLSDVVKILFSDEVVKKLRQKYAKILEKFI